MPTWIGYVVQPGSQEQLDVETLCAVAMDPVKQRKLSLVLQRLYLMNAPKARLNIPAMIDMFLEHITPPRMVSCFWPIDRCISVVSLMLPKI